MTDPEAAVLGACLLDASAYWRCADLLTEDDFAKGGYRRLWSLIVGMFREGGSVDPITVGEREPGLAELAFDCTGSAGATANARTYAEIVAKRAVERRVIAAGGRIAGLRGEDSLGEAQRILATCAPRNASAVRRVRDFLRESVTALQERYEAAETLTGLATSIPALDEITSGWQRSDLIILAARPSLGKTALALQCALSAGQTDNPTLFFSAEMAGRQLTDRAIAHLARVPLNRIRAPKSLEAEDWSAITPASQTLSSMPLWIDDSGGITVDAIAARARQIDAENRLGLIVIDYLTHLRLPKAETVAESIQIATRQLKDLAKALSVPVILLSQLNRDGAQKPTLATLRGSGAIEQDADVIVFLHRPNEVQRDLVTLEVAKQRNGETGEIWLQADMARMRFTETTEPQHEPEQQRRSGFRGRGLGSARDRAAGNYT